MPRPAFVPAAAPTLPLSLTGMEVVYLTDSVKGDDAAQGLPEKERYVPLARQALLLLGSAYNEVVSLDPSGMPLLETGPVVLHFTEETCWLLREKVKTGSMGIDGKTNVGIPLLTKLYTNLLEFNSELEIQAGAEDAPITDNQRLWINKLKEYRDASRSKQDGSPVEDGGARAEPRQGASNGPGADLSGPEI